ncbi:hypothetical protein ACQ4WX_00800 [Streptomyces lasalocidi]
MRCAARWWSAPSCTESTRTSARPARSWRRSSYVALAPDYYWRNARRTALGYSAEEREDGLVLMRALDRDELVADASAALATARAEAGGGAWRSSV